MGRMLGTGGLPHEATRGSPGRWQYEAPYGNSLVGAYAMAAQRHMHEFGTTLGAAGRDRGRRPRVRRSSTRDALYRDPITVDDVLNSRMIADPLHKLDCCVITDGGGAFIMTTAERARDLKQPPVYVLGAGGRADALEHQPDARLHPTSARDRRARAPSTGPA